MTRRANGEGTIGRRSDGRWEVRYFVPKGSGRERRVIYAKTRTEAREALRTALADRDRGVVPAPARETVGSFLTAWCEGVEATVRGRTVDSYRQIVASHLVPLLGAVRLSRLSPEHVQRAYRELADRDLSPKTVLNCHLVLHAALAQAWRWRLIASNPADLVTPPRVPRHEMKVLSAEQVRQVLGAADDDPLGAAFYTLAVSTGLRLGELCALRWPHVDLDRGTVSVVGTLEQRAGHGHTVAEPKTQRSRRQVELGAATVEALRRHRAVSSSIGFVFHRADGQPLSRSIVDKAWRRLNERAGVPAVRFHDLRHTSATLMLEAGVNPKVASDRLGHASVSITLDRYSHAVPALGREAAQLVDNLLQPAGVSVGVKRA